MFFSHIKYYTKAVKFEYICEHCGKESGLQTAEFRIGATSDLKGWNLSEKADRKLTEDAQKSVVKNMAKYRKDVEEKQKFCDFFPNECPHCGKKQRWGKGNTKRNQLIFTLVCAGAGMAASLFLNKADGFNLALMIFCAAIGFFIGICAGPIIFICKQAAFPPKLEHVPVVHWPEDVDALSGSKNT